MQVKHRLKGKIGDPLTFMIEHLYKGSFTLEAYFNDRRWYPDVPSRQYVHRLYGEYLKITYSLCGHLYFTEAQYLQLYEQHKLDEWLQWYQGSSGNYMDDRAIWTQAKKNLHIRLINEKKGD